MPGVEEVRDGAYRRSLRLPHGAAIVELRPADGHVRARFWLDDLRDLAAAVQRCRALLDLDADPVAVDERLGERPAARRRSCAPRPGAACRARSTAHELAVRAVLGQQVSVAGARTLAGRLAAALRRAARAARSAR